SDARRDFLRAVAPHRERPVDPDGNGPPRLHELLRRIPDPSLRGTAASHRVAARLEPLVDDPRRLVHRARRGAGRAAALALRRNPTAGERTASVAVRRAGGAGRRHAAEGRARSALATSAARVPRLTWSEPVRRMTAPGAGNSRG